MPEIRNPFFFDIYEIGTRGTAHLCTCSDIYVPTTTLYKVTKCKIYIMITSIRTCVLCMYQGIVDQSYMLHDKIEYIYLEFLVMFNNCFLTGDFIFIDRYTGA